VHPDGVELGAGLRNDLSAVRDDQRATAVVIAGDGAEDDSLAAARWQDCENIALAAVELAEDALD